MNARRMTRRSLLAVSAGALAGAATRPAGVLAALTRSSSASGAGLPVEDRPGTPGHPSPREQWLGRGHPGERTVGLALPADLIGLRWQGPAGAEIELRFRGEDGSWSRWAAAGAHGHAPEGGTAAGTLEVGDPVWTGGTR